MVRTVLLLCSMSVDPSSCTLKTALHHAFLPTPTVICGVGGETVNAAAGEMLRPVPGRSYLKLSCERDQ